MLSAVVHGNEPCGAHALDYLLREEVRLVRGEAHPRVHERRGVRLVRSGDSLRVPLRRRGLVIGRDGDHKARTPYPDCVLIMPSRRLRGGGSAVRLGRYVG